MIRADRLRELLHYDPISGELTWKKIRNGVRRSVAGYVNKLGYRMIGIDMGYYQAHQLAWLHYYGEWPLQHLDHKDGNPSNNAITNLRLATRSQNMANQKKSTRNTSGFKGVTFYRRTQKWRAQIKSRGKQVMIGDFRTPEEAHAAYGRAAAEVHGEFARVS